MQCRTIRPSRVQSSSQCRWHLSLVDRSCDGSADRVEHSHGEGGYSTVHQSVHDEWWSTAEQHPADICELSREREGGRVRWCVFRMYASIFDRVRVAMEDMWHRADRSADNHHQYSWWVFGHPVQLLMRILLWSYSAESVSIHQSSVSATKHRWNRHTQRRFSSRIDSGTEVRISVRNDRENLVRMNDWREVNVTTPLCRILIQ